MAGLWYRVGTVSVTNGSKKVTGFGTQFKTGTYKPDKGHAFYGPDGKVYEIDYVESDTVLYLVKAYTGATAAVQSYEIDITRTGTTPALSREVSAMLAYAQGQYDGWQQILTGSGNVTLAAPDGQTISVPALSNMLSKSGNLAGLDAPDTALSNLGMTQVGKAVAKATNAAAGRTALGIVKQTNSADTTAGALLEVGSFGLGALNPTTVTDFNTVTLPGFYRTLNTVLNGPMPGVWGKVLVSAYGPNDVSQIWIRNSTTPQLFTRSMASGVWGAWTELHSQTTLPYETGTFTPTAVGGTVAGAATYSVQSGSYTRIGNIVFYTARAVWTGHTGTGELRITGLPFVSAASPSRSQQGGVLLSGVAFTGSPYSLVANASNHVRVGLNAPGAGYASLQVPAAVSNIEVSGFYFI